MGAHLRKHRRSVASGASHVFMHAQQRIPSTVMIELGHRSYRLPTRIGMAVLAGDADRAVWIGHFGPRQRCRRRRRRRGISRRRLLRMVERKRRTEDEAHSQEEPDHCKPAERVHRQFALCT